MFAENICKAYIYYIKYIREYLVHFYKTHPYYYFKGQDVECY